MLTASGYTHSPADVPATGESGRPSEVAGSSASALSVHPGTVGAVGEPDGTRGWLVKAYPAAREAVVVLQGGGQAVTPRTAPADEEEARRRREDNEKRVARRRRAECRRYCAGNLLTVLWTFTYKGDGCHDRSRAVRDFAEFIKRFRKEFGPQPYLYVLELHPGGHGWHIHMALPGKHFSHQRMTELWGHGFTHYRRSKDLGDDGPGGPGRGGRQQARRVAAYLSKYLVKDMHPGEGRHGYDVADGFQVRARVFRMVPKLANVRRLLDHFDLGKLTWSCSDTWPGWNGPPTYTIGEA